MYNRKIKTYLENQMKLSFQISVININNDLLTWKQNLKSKILFKKAKLRQA